MCGICGYISRRDISRDQLRAMNDTMAERGPDDAGVEQWALPGGYTLGMAQRRLSILDLSPLGHQPMSVQDGRIRLVYNGEIYNYREIRNEIPEYAFRSNCDTEVILAAYLKWGIGCIERFNGMFAIALYDCGTGELFLARDRAGQKPLYYWLDGENLVFASVLAPLMSCPGFPKKVRRDVLPRYLYQEYINAPDTIFGDVFQVEPGTVLTFRPFSDTHPGHNTFRASASPAGGAVPAAGSPAPQGASKVQNPAAGADSIAGTEGPRLAAFRYWDFAERYHSAQEHPVTDYEEAKAGLKAALQASVARRMISDVPLGTFLSGGYDSSLISALAQEQLGSGRRLKTFSVGFEEEAYDESPYAREVARHLGTDHTEMIIGGQDMLELVADLPKYYDEPMADSSQIPTMLVSKAARQKVTVALSGDAGDEFYCGYGIYDRVRQAQELDKIGGAAHAIGQIPLGKGKRLEDRYPFRVRVISANRNPLTKTQFGAGSYVNLARELVLPEAAGGRGPSSDTASTASGRACGGAGTGRRSSDADGMKWNGREYTQSREGFLAVNYEMEDRYPSGNWQITRMLLDMDTYLPGDILTKVDRASMKYSLESRCPFLDPEVMEYSFRIGHDFKYHKDGKNWSKKYILKSIAYDYIPKDLLDRPKKGFSVPLSSWLRGPLREQLLRYADAAFLQRQGLFDADRTVGLVSRFLAEGDAGAGTGRNYAKLVWSFFVFQQWAEYWGV